MKHLSLIIIIILFAVSAHAANVGVSVSVGQPGFYGHIDIGNMPPPALIYPTPVVIVPPPGHVVMEPIYLHVPPGHEKHWSKNCRKYNACGRPVYFVRDKWYNDVYVPHYRAAHGKGHYKNHNGQHGKGHNEGDHGHGKGHNRD